MKLRSCLWLTVLFTFIAHGDGFAQSKVRKIDQLLTRYQSAGQFNGSVLIVERGKMIYRKGFGFANFEWKIPNTPDSKFRIGSITKSFTSILVLQLVEEGKLRLDGKVTDYLSNFSKKTGDRITVNQLLTHTAGLPDYNNVQDFFRMVQSGLLSRDEIIKRISEYDLLFEPGTKFGYSNDGYVLLGAIIEKVTGKTYEQVLRENILNPLGLKNTGYSSRSAVLEKRASGYRKTLAGLENASFYEQSPASGMYSTVEDLYLWAQALEGDRLLAAKHKGLMWSLSQYGNAYGWHVSKTSLGQGNDLKVMTEGAVFGFFARFIRLPNDKGTIILLNNVRAATNFLPDIEREITNILYGRAYQFPRRSIAEALLPTIKQKGVEAALEQYSNLKSKRQNVYNFAENELNSLGYFLLNNLRRINDAIEIFKLNIKEYPQSSNAYDSLGEAYMVKGDKELAISNYQRSVELNPQNSSAIEMLKKLRSQ